MTRALPSLEEPAPGTHCPHCNRPLRIEGFCAPCFEESLQVREQLVETELAGVRKRARAWALGRAVQS